MTIELTSKDVKCRKEHRCEWCGEVIINGSAAHYRSGRHDGRFISEYYHPECWAALLKSDLGYDDEFMPMDQERGKTFEECHG
jgi:hypothetical protein